MSAADISNLTGQMSEDPNEVSQMSDPSMRPDVEEFLSFLALLEMPAIESQTPDEAAVVRRVTWVRRSPAR